MNSVCRYVLAGSLILSAGTAFAANAGESWDISSKTTMEGLPEGMADATVTVCLAKGAEKDPKQLVRQSGDCTVSDVKTSAGKTSWKMRCDRDGEVMTGTGEVRHKTGSFQGVTRLSGMSHGEKVSMTAEYQGKKLNKPCDPSAAPVVKGSEDMNEMMSMVKSQMSSAMAEQCEVSNFRPAELISNRFFGPKAACAGKEKFACKVISKDIAKNAATFIKLAKHDDTSDVSIASACGIDMSAATKAVCATVGENNHRDLAEYCPAEAKAFEAKQNPPDGAGSEPSSSSVLDGAKKLKGLFGF